MDWRAYDREFDAGGPGCGTTIFVDILNPFLVATEVVGRYTDDFDVLRLEAVGSASNLSEFRRAYLNISNIRHQIDRERWVDSPG